MRINRWAGRAAALCAAAPLAMGMTATPAAAAAAPPGEPDAERISAGPYEGFQFCQSAPLRVNSASPTLAASPTPPRGSTAPPFAPFPGLTGNFEVARPDGQVLIRQTTRIENGRLFVFQVPPDRLADGQYRWRVQASNGSTVSPWTPWCAFTLTS